MSDAVEKQAADLAAGFEGLSLCPYLDPAGIPTIGYGSIWDWRNTPHTRVTMDTPPIDEPTARLWLGWEMLEAIQTVARDVTVPLTNNQTAALADFVFNLGSGNFAGSTLLRLLNSGDYEGAAAQFDRWDHAGGVELAGLLRRRKAETALFKTPDPPTQETPT